MGDQGQRGGGGTLKAAGCVASPFPNPTKEPAWDGERGAWRGNTFVVRVCYTLSLALEMNPYEYTPSTSASARFGFLVNLVWWREGRVGVVCGLSVYLSNTGASLQQESNGRAAAGGW